MQSQLYPRRPPLPTPSRSHGAARQQSESRAGQGPSRPGSGAWRLRGPGDPGVALALGYSEASWCPRGGGGGTAGTGRSPWRQPQEPGVSPGSPGENQTHNQDLPKNQSSITEITENTSTALRTEPCPKHLPHTASFNPFSHPGRQTVSSPL